jgi:hypothetical protein
MLKAGRSQIRVPLKSVGRVRWRTQATEFFFHNGIYSDCSVDKKLGDEYDYKADIIFVVYII